ncbi:hypothetical protein GH714_040357 [Hevea brasiliensis]|uniref:Uncharacterized protein n=1 Tax=Hevea brasiliensis TaxID=3981 RepID=A0A6A6MS26_HEVBR|nr:hypothetical protein GH714_040357 [Hevea brasiliensis]
MCSVQLGSEFYFLGGEHDLEHPRAPFDQWFPKVYIFDPIDSKGSMKRGVSMNTGKVDPCAVVADVGEDSSDKYLWFAWTSPQPYLKGEKHESMKRKQEDSWKHENMKRNKKITGSMRA